MSPLVAFALGIATMLVISALTVILLLLKSPKGYEKRAGLFFDAEDFQASEGVRMVDNFNN